VSFWVTAEGITAIRQGLAVARGIGAELLWPDFLALFAEVNGHTGEDEDGLRVITEALMMARQPGARVGQLG
jgi:hypothetical protein